MNKALLLWIAELGPKPRTVVVAGVETLVDPAEDFDAGDVTSKTFTGPDGRTWVRNAFGIGHNQVYPKIFNVSYSDRGEPRCYLRSECYSRPQVT